MTHPSRRARWIGLGVAVALAASLVGCSSSGSEDSSAGPTESGAPASDSTSEEASPADDLSGTLTIFAAASLKATFDQLRTAFMAAHPNVDFPEITYDGSSTLVKQLQDGAPADVFASADEANMDKVTDLVTGRVDFATNSLQIAVEPGNPLGISSLADIAQPDVKTVICAAEVPCGAASHRALDAAGVDLTPVSEEQNVTAVLAKVAAKEADAGLVYATDVNSAKGGVDGIDFPEASQAVNTYPIAVLKDSQNSDAAQDFIDLVTSEAGQKVLAGVGFGAP